MAYKNGVLVGKQVVLSKACISLFSFDLFLLEFCYYQ